MEISYSRDLALVLDFVWLLLLTSRERLDDESAVLEEGREIGGSNASKPMSSSSLDSKPALLEDTVWS